MRLQPIINRLDPLGFKTLGGAMEYAELKTLPGRLPAAFVVPQSKSASPSARVGVIDQKVSALFAVVIILPATRAGNRLVATDLEDFEAAVVNALVGWTHPDATLPTEFADAAVLSVDGTAFTWAIRFRTSYHIRKGP
jgi:hypothetical protein